ncbi:MAG: hypothetical protein ABI576_14105 [Flavobacterium sp.]
MKKRAMKVSDENKVLIGVAVIGAGALGFLYWKNKQNEAGNALSDIPELAEPTTATNPIPQTGDSLNRNKLLAKGSKGLEVRELQRLLGVKIDGDFGNITLTALLAKKGVSQISLNAFSAKTKAKAKIKAPAKPVVKTLAKVLPRVGEKLQATKDTNLFVAQKGADGKYFGTGDKFFSGGDLKYGDSAGTFVDANATGSYLVKIFGGFAFVKADSVKTY